jgi:acetoin utilization deacetylase AcuC-like enzyme
MFLATDDLCLLHETGTHPERPARLVAVMQSIEESRPGLFAARRRLAAASTRDLARVHDEAMIALVAAAAAAGPTWLDPDTVASLRSFDAALAAAGQVLGAARAVLAGEDKLAFAAVRPPGHHATRSQPMGFCLANNIAVAARGVQADGAGRVAILDFDVHHGNGTQEIFWEDASVFYASLHRYPFYPGTGAADETGAGAALGTKKNFPLPYKTTPDEFLNALAAALAACAEFGPDLLLVSAGFDAFKDDPIGGLHLEVEHFQTIGLAIRATAESVCEGRVVSALEGGYHLGRLGACVLAYIEGLEQGG